MRLASVTSTSPLQVRRDGDRLAVPATDTTLTLAVFDRVLTETIDNIVYIIKKV